MSREKSQIGRKAQTVVSRLAIIVSVMSAACGDSTMTAPAAPTLRIDAPARNVLFVADVLDLNARTWHGVADAEILWRSSNTRVARVDGAGRVTALAPGAVTISASAEGVTDALELDVRPLPLLYGEEQIEYFGEIAFGTEAGEATPILRKWASSPRIKVTGDPTSEDLAALERVVSDLNDLAPSLGLQTVEEGHTVEVHFVPVEDFAEVEPNYEPGNLGYFWVWWNRQQEITYARVLIATDGVSQSERSHLVREELTQVLGLMRDSWAYPQSVFYQGWTDTAEFADIDRALVEMLYRTDLPAGTTREAALDVLARATVDRDRAMAMMATPGASAANGRAALDAPAGEPGSGGGSGGLDEGGR